MSTYHIFITRLSAGGILDWFCLLETVNTAAVNTGMLSVLEGVHGVLAMCPQEWDN